MMPALSWSNKLGRDGALYRRTGNGQRAAIAVNECAFHARSMFSISARRPEGRRLCENKFHARIPTLIDPDGPGGKPLTVTQSWAILMYLCEKGGKFLPADPIARVRMFQWMAEGAADYASVNQPSSSSARMRKRCRLRRSSSTKTGSSICGGLADEATRQDRLSGVRRDYRRRSRGLPDLCGRKALPDNAGLKASAGLGRACRRRGQGCKRA